jgi:hypothetical protein
VRSSLVPARKSALRPGRYCIRLSRDLTSAVSWVMSCLARLARDRLSADQIPWAAELLVRPLHRGQAAAIGIPHEPGIPHAQAPDRTL